MPRPETITNPIAISSEGVNVPNIPALSSEVQKLQNATDWWTNAALWLTALAAIVAVQSFRLFSRGN